MCTSVGRIRVTAQLIDAVTDTHLWSHKFDRELGDVLSIQDDIATEVANRLQLTMMDTAPRLVELDQENYTLFLQARSLKNLGTAESTREAIAFFQRVVAAEPKHAPSWYHLSVLHLDQVIHGWTHIDESLRLARHTATEAISADADYAPGHIALAATMLVDPEADDQGTAFQQIVNLVLQALAINSGNADNIRMATIVSITLGRLEDAMVLARYANTLDPINANAAIQMAIIYNYAQRWSEAEASARRALELSSNISEGSMELGIALLNQGQIETALIAFEQETNPALKLKGTAIAYSALDRPAKFELALSRLKADFGKSNPAAIAQVYTSVGDNDAAFAWLDRAADSGYFSTRWLFQDSLLHNLHSDSRWGLFLAKTGTNPERLANFEFEPLPYLQTSFSVESPYSK
ncbi:MAG: tetratricopeptide repeat protein [bacterium]|nr:tetratricopeptide repeat protein [Gammaproteobacteria bacterium]HIL96019.1 tetratricopeptide repeat protein [Pseudomonadales bacterium]